MPPEELGPRLRRLREQKNLSLSRLAGMAGISKAYLHQIESGRSERPSAEALYSLAQSLGTSIAYLLGKERQPEKPAVPHSLRLFARETGLSEQEVAMLAGIRYRGRSPRSVADWRYLYESIKRCVGPAGEGEGR